MYILRKMSTPTATPAPEPAVTAWNILTKTEESKTPTLATDKAYEKVENTRKLIFVVMCNRLFSKNGIHITLPIFSPEEQKVLAELCTIELDVLRELYESTEP